MPDDHWNNHDGDSDDWNANEWNGDSDWDEDDWNDDDWNDDANDDADDEESAPCPECGKEILVDAEMCSACGYWLSTSERHAMWSGGSRSTQLVSVGKVILVVVLIALLSGLMIF